MGFEGTTPRVLRFGVFELDRHAGELRREGLRVRLQEQPMRVLEALLETPGEPVTRDALRQRLWPDDTFVDFDNGLNRAINRVRTALGDDAENPRFVETLGRRGYRFIAPVASPEAGTPPAPAAAAAASDLAQPTVPGRRRAAWLAGAAAVIVLAGVLAAFRPGLRGRSTIADRPAIRSLAVLPLANLSGDPAQEYFSDGMTDALITSLASWPGLRVISRQSVMRYKGSAKPLPDIARELGVEGVVEGSVVRSGGRVRISAQLIDAPSDRHLWAHAYERSMEDVLALQDEISRAIADEVRLTVGAGESGRPARPRTVKPDAYDAYLMGRNLWNQRTAASLEKAVAYFQAAIAGDPDFAPAHAGVALAYGPQFVSGYIPAGRGPVAMKAAALEALELDPRLAEAHAALAGALQIEWDWQGAEREYRRAIGIDPNSSVAHLWYGWYLHAFGRFEESLAQRRRALEIDPFDVTANRGVALDLDATGQEEAAAARWSRALELRPDDAHTHLYAGVFHLEHGRAEEGWRHLDRARALEPDDPSVLASIAVESAASGRRDEARRLLARLETPSAGRYVSPVILALVHEAMSDEDRAFALLERAYAARDPLLIPIQTAGTPLGLRLPRDRAAAFFSDPRYDDLVRRMDLPRRRVPVEVGSPRP